MPRSRPSANLPIGFNGHPIERLARPQPWKADANCSGLDPDLFYPPFGAAGRLQAAEARAVCAGCPVRIECLAYAMGNGEEFGIWGGTTERDRRMLRALIVAVRPGPHRRHVA